MGDIISGDPPQGPVTGEEGGRMRPPMQSALQRAATPKLAILLGRHRVQSPPSGLLEAKWDLPMPAHTTLLPVGEEHRLVIAADRAWVVDGTRERISVFQDRRPGENDLEFRRRMQAWVQVLVTYLSPAD